MNEVVDSKIDDLYVDAVDYLFTEWLVRRGIFSAYKANFKRYNDFDGTFRGVLRDWIRTVLRSSRSSMGDLLDASFPFVATPEGFYFWTNHSAAWSRFCNEFKDNL